MRFAQRLKKLRKELNLTQNDLAKSCNVKLTFISKYENEVIKPGFDMLAKIGMAYNVNLNWLLNGLGTMFIETPARKLLKDATNNYYVATFKNTPAPVAVKTEEHSLELASDLKVEYYGADNDTCTKIYHKNGVVEYFQEGTPENRAKAFEQRIDKICNDENQFEFVMTAIRALDNKKALRELKTLIKGMEISK